MPFNYFPVNKDKEFLTNLNDFLPHYHKYFLEKEKMLKDTANQMSTAQLEQFVIVHQEFEKIIKDYRTKYGNRFVAQSPFPKSKDKFFRKLVKNSYFPNECVKHFPASLRAGKWFTHECRKDIFSNECSKISRINDKSIFLFFGAKLTVDTVDTVPLAEFTLKLKKPRIHEL